MRIRSRRAPALAALAFTALTAGAAFARGGVTVPGGLTTHPGQPHSDRRLIVVRLQGSLDALAELLLVDPFGRRVGADPSRGARFNEIPEAGYGEEALDGPGERWKVLEVHQPLEGPFRVAVIGTHTARYKLLVLTMDRGGNEQGRVTVDDVPTAPGVVHHYTITYAAAPGTPLTLGGGFDGGGQRPRDVNKFLTYANPSASRTHLPAGQMNVAVMVFFGDTIIPQTFRATLNGVDITPSFAPSAGGHHVVPLTLPRGSNVLLLSVEGTLADGRVATDTDRLVFVVP